uniref:NADH dehydrogenase subunit 5 n=1 Tax=Modiolus modulaides TaxID=2784319 RepID=UPI002237C0A0|nr:NADH dehydrogenase subunit 5 [Modiolus modulaides]UYA96810.1 NADH dehydrogenase subunit 5 [Modiolus modulaides]
MIQFSKVLGLSFLGVGVLALFLSYSVSLSVLEYSVWNCYGLSLNFSLLFDCSSLLFMSTVFIISGSVLIYCSWYMDDEIYYKRFIFLVLLFVTSMVFLILIPNLICLLIGWDGLGITSFLLVVFYQNNKSLGAGMVTALVNRIGDVLLLTVIGLMVNEGGWMLYNGVMSWEYSGMPVILLVGAITKSAQMPFSAWLPAAMAAPTPVSSLVHSSTLVTAGVYLLYRSGFILLSSEVGVEMLKVLSLLTLVMAGSSALAEIDLKKVIALSTLSQLSMMLFSISLGLLSVSFFHLITHASFKALLFLCAGVVIHNNMKCQDIRSLGKSWSLMPVSMSCLVVANMSLCGVHFLSGFYSKDMIIEMSLMGNESVFIYVLVILGTLFTSWYSLRVMLNVLFGVNKVVVKSVFGEESNVLKASYFVLLVSSVMMGWVLSSGVENLGCSVQLTLVDKMMAMSFLFLAAGLFSSSVVYEAKSFLSKPFWFLSGMWNLKWLTTQGPSQVLMLYSDVIISSLEKGWLEKVGPQGSLEVLSVFSGLGQTYQQYSFLKMILLSVVSLSLLLFLSFSI